MDCQPEKEKFVYVRRARVTTPPPPATHFHLNQQIQFFSSQKTLRHVATPLKGQGSTLVMKQLLTGPMIVACQ